MTDNRYDEYDDLPSVSIADDDIDSRHYGRPKTIVKKSSPLLAFVVFLLVIAVAALGGVGYLTIDKLRKENASLKKSQQKTLTILSEVTGKLSATGADLAKTTSKREAQRVKMKEQLELAHTEIRKLWDLSNKRNKPDIVANQQAAEKNAKAIAKLTNELGDKASTVEQLAKDYKTSQAKIATLTTELAQLKKANAKLSKQLNKQPRSNPADETAISVLTEQLNQLEQTVATLSAQQKLAGQQDKAKQADLLKQVEAHAETLKAIDAFRRQVNNQLLQIKKKLK
ncbi:hypothetical protein H0A36_15600 [Endozoicomonas sp. SM1973]|uniref:Uncharacterized protein n=1 Tax=Spartinivicinus marinus TaxID=2994442 RepID=A0A853IC22_9GAMM|nr:hypothetical protein [Spartinivicinus marinus]MCX4028445.1 hypothetical protein [Spartinivicinus marinus]NYZ67441.1 hypothetical protein [Spartinivicinus marinus]